MSDKAEPFAAPTLGRPLKGSEPPVYTSRIQVKLTPAVQAQLDEICKRTRSNQSDVVREALRVYDVLTEQLLVNGNELLLADHRKPTPERLIILPQQKQPVA